jgi:hypothetical protein
VSYSPYPPRHVRLARHFRYEFWPIIWRLVLYAALLVLVVLYSRMQP